CLHISPQRRKPGKTLTYGIILVQNINTRIHRNAAKQYERSETTLIEIQPEPVKRQKHPDIRHRNHKDNRQRLPQRVKQDTRNKENNADYNQQQTILLVILSSPRPVVIL